MAEMPSCNKCGNPHWRFVACEDRQQYNVDHERTQARKRASYPITSCPEGFSPWRAGGEDVNAYPIKSVPEGFRVSTRPLMMNRSTPNG